jgi:hypothetical protein
MATRSYIAKKMQSGYKAIYCHWDGYPSGVGATLRKYYKLPAKINRLLNLGSISVLRKNIGKRHSFNKASRAGKYGEEIERKGWTTAYHRDRGEAWSDVKPRLFKTKKELKDFAKKGWTEYLYIYESGKWHTYAI